MNSPTQGQPNPWKIRWKVAFAPLFPTAIFFRGLGLVLYSLGLPRVSNLNSKLVLISKCQTTVHRNILPVYGTFDEKSAIKGILKAQQNQAGDTDTVTVYLFLAKIPCLSWFSKCQTTLDHWFPASLRYISQFTVHSTTTKPRVGYRYTVYCHGIPLDGNKYVEVFHFVLVLEDVFSF